MTSNNEPSIEKSVKNYKLIIFVAAFSAFLATFNETFLNVSFAAVMEDFGVGVNTVQWLATAYMDQQAAVRILASFLALPPEQRRPA